MTKSPWCGLITHWRRTRDAQLEADGSVEACVGELLDLVQMRYCVTGSPSLRYPAGYATELHLPTHSYPLGGG